MLRRNKKFRWINNFSLAGLNSLFVKLFVPLIVYQTALSHSSEQQGLFYLLHLPTSIAFLLSILVLDLTVYWQHRIFHRISMLWKIHRVHHADQDIDISTGVRFHPIEIIISLWVKVAVVMLLGISPLAFITFEVILSSSAIFTHCNVQLNTKYDRWLKYFIVTPNMHRIHHSKNTNHSNCNFGFFLSVWDRLFGSYIELPNQDYQVGTEEFDSKREIWLDKLLSQPFRRK